jgi:hypothetical protein
MKIPTTTFANATPITSPVETETGGVAFEKITSMTGIEQLDKSTHTRSHRADRRRGSTRRFPLPYDLRSLLHGGYSRCRAAWPSPAPAEPAISLGRRAASHVEVTVVPEALTPRGGTAEQWSASFVAVSDVAPGMLGNKVADGACDSPDYPLDPALRSGSIPASAGAGCGAVIVARWAVGATSLRP